MAGAVALVTGASRGIGLACADALSRRGMRVAMVARDADDLAEEGAHALAPCSEGDIPTTSVADLIRQYTPEG